MWGHMKPTMDIPTNKAVFGYSENMMFMWYCTNEPRISLVPHPRILKQMQSTPLRDMWSFTDEPWRCLEMWSFTDTLTMGVWDKFIWLSVVNLWISLAI